MFAALWLTLKIILDVCSAHRGVLQFGSSSVWIQRILIEMFNGRIEALHSLSDHHVPFLAISPLFLYFRDRLVSWKVWQQDGTGLFLSLEIILQIDTTVHFNAIRLIPGLRAKVDIFLRQFQIVGPLRTDFASVLNEGLEGLGLLLQQVVNLLVNGSPLVVKRLQLDAIGADLPGT